MAIDPITLEVIKNGLDSVADQIALVLMRSAYSPIVRDSLDYSTAVCDRNGRFVAQGLTTALHLGSFPYAMENLVTTRRAEMRPGDIFIFNDPYGSGGMHLPDIYLVRPVFLDGEVEGYATALVHHADTGGIAPGAMAVYATEIFQEGLRIPLMKLYDGGEPNRTVFDFVAANVRIPRQVIGDLRAQVAGVLRGEQGLLDIIGRYGSGAFAEHCQALHERAEAAMREVIGAIPDGDYEHADWIDGLGEDPEPIRLQVRISIRGSDVEIDWDGTSPQVRAAINAPIPFIYSASYLPFRCLAGHEIPNAQGYTVPITVKAPAGSIVNPHPPAAANARGIVGFRAFDAVAGALAKAMPGSIPAGSEGGAINFGIGGQIGREPYVFGETTMGAWGGRSDRDGVDGAANLAANQSNQPIELIEAENPLRILQYGFVPDSGGAGRFRGGQAILRQYRFLAEGLLTFRSDRRSVLPPAREGGLSGTPNLNLLHTADCSVRTLPVLPMEGYTVTPGDVFSQVVPGGGGYGDPFDRDPALVLQDVRDGKFSEAYAREVYGVAIAGEVVHFERTAELRQGAPTGGERRHLAFFESELGRLLPELSLARDRGTGQMTPSSRPVVEVDLAAIRHNTRVVRHLVGPTTRIYAVVKGDGYGTGAVEAGKAALAGGADALAAGDVAEALAVKAALPSASVLVYGTYLPEQIPVLAGANIWPTLFSPECIKAAAASPVPVTAFLEVDCGFGRLGFTEQQAILALERIRSAPRVNLRGLYTHLGQVDHPSAVEPQMARFRHVLEAARTRLGYQGLEHMVASSRVLVGYPELGLQAVNPGRMLYGLLEPPWDDSLGLQPAYAAVRTRLIQTRSLQPDRMLGYGGLPEITSELYTGVAPLGFAGGLPRTMAGAPVLVRGRKVKVLGLASMEHLLLDLSEVPEAQTGDEVVVIGSQGGETITGTEFARGVGLTELEAVPRLGRGLPRQYLGV